MGFTGVESYCWTCVLLFLFSVLVSVSHGIEVTDIPSCTFDAWKPNQPTIALTCIPLRGHLTPLLYVAQELAIRQHNVLLAVPTKAMKWVPQELLHSTIIVRELETTYEEETSTGFMAMLKRRFLLTDAFFQPYDTLVELLISAEECGYPVDALYVDFISSFGFDAANKLNITAIASVPMVGAYQQNSMLIPSTSSGFPLEMSVFERVISFLMAQVKPILHIPMMIQVNQLRKERGLSLRHRVEQYLDDCIQVCYTSFGFEYPQVEPPTVVHVGPPHTRTLNGQSIVAFDRVVPPLREDVQMWLDQQHKQNREVIYVSAGSTKMLTRGVAVIIDQAMRDLVEKRGVVDSGLDEEGTIREVSVLFNVDREAFFPDGHWSVDGPLEGRALFAAEVEQPFVLLHPSVRVFLSHCGLNGVSEAILSGVPVVGIPHRFDQSDNAARLVDAGLGLAMPVGILQWHSLSSTVSHVLDHYEDYHTNAMRLRQHAFSDGGSSAVVDVIERILSGGLERFQLNQSQQNPLVPLLFPCVVLLLMAWSIYRLVSVVFKYGRRSSAQTEKEKSQ